MVEFQTALAAQTSSNGMILSEDEIVHSLISGRTGFVPNIKLLQGGSPEIAQYDNYRPGDFILDENNLGRNVELNILVCRPHAMYIKDKQKVSESYVVTSEEFIRIQTMRIPRMQPQTEYTRFGYEWLCYIPSCNLFGTLYLGKNNIRFLSGKILTCLMPPDKRKAGQFDVPFTSNFKLTSAFVTVMNKGDIKAWLPVIEPIVGVVLPAPNPEDLKRFLTAFNNDVINEQMFLANRKTAVGTIPAGVMPNR